MAAAFRFRACESISGEGSTPQTCALGNNLRISCSPTPGPGPSSTIREGSVGYAVRISPTTHVPKAALRFRHAATDQTPERSPRPSALTCDEPHSDTSASQHRPEPQPNPPGQSRSGTRESAR